ncbi:actinia tenebrosa protease inhibitors-like [Dermacentor variabilis]|uniref:actinia tenebrosa protease inhibitors-like n=1 Tax=Dermacentor variabilis TaxID=34621 RepID=UPI003F5AE66F
MRFLCCCFIFTINVVLGPAYSETTPERCLKEPETGNCRAYQPTWYFDKNFSRCRMFIYGGCGGNDNQFTSERKCLSFCLPSSPQKRVCSPKPKPGPCNIPSNFWYFESGSATCHRYKRGLCERGANKYPSCDKCMATCTTNSETRPARCFMRPESGNCRAYIPTWYFDPKISKCRVFVYGGCDGNENQFRSEKECQSVCLPSSERRRVCSPKPRRGLCNTHSYFWYFDPASATCRRYRRHVCDRGSNKFLSCERCVATCTMHAAPAVNSCGWNVLQQSRDNYTTNKHSNCLDHCHLHYLPFRCTHSETQQDRCSMPPDRGRCRAYMPTWFYDSKFSSCKMFIYGGCGGNDNQFPSEKKCESVCLPQIKSPTRCLQPADPGPCRAYKPRWFFDSSTSHCKLFIFGGCSGNENRFDSEKMCLETCLTGRKAKPVCSRSPYTQRCASGPRWFLNSSRNACQQLPHGSCATSANRFPTCVKCTTRCTNYNAMQKCHELVKALPAAKKVE